MFNEWAGALLSTFTNPSLSPSVCMAVPRRVGAEPKLSSIAGGVGGGSGDSWVEEDGLVAVHDSIVFGTFDGLGRSLLEIIASADVEEGDGGLFVDRGCIFCTVVLIEVEEGCWFSDDLLTG